MDNKLYAKIKLTLLNYDFDKPANFGDLFKYSKQYSHGRPFKQFVKICQNMGVVSKVVRSDVGLTRVLVYKPENDRYLKGEIKTLMPCKACKGSGVVEKPVEVTELNQTL